MYTMLKFMLRVGFCSLLHSAVFAADVGAGEQKAQACFGCHGSEGNSSNPSVPNLAGQQPAYLSNQIMAFRDNKRVNPIMAAQVKQLSDNDAADIAAYFAKRQTKSAGGNALLVEAGATKAVQCTGCHTAKFTGRAAIPKLAGQQPGYLSKQLRNFKSGERKSGPMQAIATNLSEADIEQLVAYLGSLP